MPCQRRSWRGCQHELAEDQHKREPRCMKCAGDEAYNLPRHSVRRCGETATTRACCLEAHCTVQVFQAPDSPRAHHLQLPELVFSGTGTVSDLHATAYSGSGHPDSAGNSSAGPAFTAARHRPGHVPMGRCVPGSRSPATPPCRPAYSPARARCHGIFHRVHARQGVVPAHVAAP